MFLFQGRIKNDFLGGDEMWGVCVWEGEVGGGVWWSRFDQITVVTLDIRNDRPVQTV